MSGDRPQGRIWGCLFWALFLVPAVVAVGWWVWNYSSIIPLSDGEYLCTGYSAGPEGIPPLFNPGNTYAVVVQGGEVVTAIQAGQEVAAPSQFRQEGHAKFVTTIEGKSVLCEQ